MKRIRKYWSENSYIATTKTTKDYKSHKNTDNVDDKMKIMTLMKMSRVDNRKSKLQYEDENKF